MYLSAENPMFIQNVPAHDVMDGVSHAYFFLSPNIHTNVTYFLLSPATECYISHPKPFCVLC